MLAADGRSSNVSVLNQKINDYLYRICMLVTNAPTNSNQSIKEFTAKDQEPHPTPVILQDL